MEITLLQPRHIYAPQMEKVRLGHIYMPTSLLSVFSRLNDASYKVHFIDENIDLATNLTPILGVNLIGAPYVNSTIEIFKKHKKKHPNAIQIVGGQGSRGFESWQLKKLFGEHIVDGNNVPQLSSVLGLEISDIKPAEQISLIPAYRSLSDSALRLYLNSEIGFYLSQGCRFSCSFCSAERTKKDLNTGKKVEVSEIYRDIQLAYEDLLYLSRRSQVLGIKKLKIYLSNLDLFQSPKELEAFLDVVYEIKNSISNINFQFRGLSTVHSFLQCHKTHPHLLKRFIDVGLYRVGFGIDGATTEVWEKVRKPHRENDCIKAIMVSNKEYGLTPENLMVFGHNDWDTEKSLDTAVRFVDETNGLYEAISRPHVAKGVVPGNDGWIDPKSIDTVNYLLNNPKAFQLLDFTTLPSSLTHPDPDFRDLVKQAFLKICKTKNCLTQYTMPEDLKFSNEKLQYAKTFNLEHYDT